MWKFLLIVTLCIIGRSLCEEAAEDERPLELVKRQIQFPTYTFDPNKYIGIGREVFKTASGAVTNAIGSFSSAFNSIFNAIISPITNPSTKVKRQTQRFIPLSDITNSVNNITKGIADQIQNGFKTVFNVFNTFTGGLLKPREKRQIPFLNEGVNIFTNGLEKVTNSIQTTANNFQKIANDFIKTFTSFGRRKREVNEKVLRAFEQFKSEGLALIGELDQLADTIQKAPRALLLNSDGKVVFKRQTTLEAKSENVFGGLAQSIRDGAQQFRELFTKVLGTFGNLLGSKRAVRSPQGKGPKGTRGTGRPKGTRGTGRPQGFKGIGRLHHGGGRGHGRGHRGNRTRRPRTTTPAA